MKFRLIGSALVLLAAGPLASQGHGQGKGNGGGHGNASHGPTMQGPSMKGPSMKGPSMKGPSMKGPSMKGPSMNGAPTGKTAHGHPAMQASPPEHDNGRANGNGRGQGHPAGALPEKASARQDRPHDQGTGNGPSVAQAPNVGIKVLQDGRHYYSRRETRPHFDFAATPRGLIDGCPPGLARKNNGCQPPGQAKQRAYQPAWWGLGGLASGPYTYADGYLLRLNGDAVAGYVPLLGGALSVGSVWPSAYAPQPVPPYYVDYYDLGPAGSYRYADDVLYRVDPATSAITAIAGLLTGDDIRIGSPMPAGYDVYNVPYPYRSQYRDGPDARYRYSDGYLYQVDPSTQLVTAAIDLLAG
jgi:hypothetical protein